MKKITVIGHFGFGIESLDGQTVKTKVLAQALCEALGEERVCCVDTHGGKKVLMKAPFQVWKAVRGAENVVMLPAHNGLRVYGPLLALARRRFRGCKLHYIVIGGWLPEFLESRSWLKKCLLGFDGIYVETQTMKRALEKQGFSNIFVMPNCKELPVLLPEELQMEYREPYRVCTFSRVMREKGIEDAVEAVNAVNTYFGRTVYALDIYGQVDPGQETWFEELRRTFPKWIRYVGQVPFDKSVETLKGYYALLFPTRFYTEGVPGTIIDAYAAGIPVIAAKWESFSDVVEDGITGMGYSFGNEQELLKVLIQTAENPERLQRMKVACLEKARQYYPDQIIKILVPCIEENDICGQ